jgi:hypothetical protein
MGGAETFTTLLNILDEAFGNFKDTRRGSNIQYQMREVCFSAFSVFFSQNPSFLAYQTAMEKNTGSSNAHTIFGINKIPTDAQIRNLLDPTKSEILNPVFLKVFSYLEETKELDRFRSIKNTLLVALDGTNYFYSENLSCPHCLVKQHKDGRTSFSHSAITPVIVTPGNSKVISLPPEIHTESRWFNQRGL